MTILFKLDKLGNPVQPFLKVVELLNPCNKTDDALLGNIRQTSRVMDSCRYDDLINCVYQVTVWGNVDE